MGTRSRIFDMLHRSTGQRETYICAMKIHLLREYIKMLRIFASSLCYCPFILQEQVTAASKNIEFKEDETMCQGLDEKKF